MNIFLTGATGFIGRRLAQHLLARGHSVTGAVRNPRAARRDLAGVHYVPIDFAQAQTADAWQPLLGGMDVVVNAVGILQQRRGQTFDVLHRAAPTALFDACVTAGVRRVVQISALGADEYARSAYHLSKKAADDHLRLLPIEHVIVQPSLVYGPGGTSARMFSALVRLPLIPLPGDGSQQVQPVHIDDLVTAMVALIEAPEPPSGAVPLVGPEPLSLKLFYTRLRSALGVSAPARFLPIPMSLMQLTARLSALVPGAMLDSETLQMLNRGNTGDPSYIRALLGREPKAVEQFVR